MSDYLAMLDYIGNLWCERPNMFKVYDAENMARQASCVIRGAP